MWTGPFCGRSPAARRKRRPEMFRRALLVAALVAVAVWAGFWLHDLTHTASVIRERAAQAEGV